MKVFGIIMKIVAALAVVAGIVYIVATYGDKIVAWAKKMLNRVFGKRTRFFDIEEQMDGSSEEAIDRILDDEAACNA